MKNKKPMLSKQDFKKELNLENEKIIKYRGEILENTIRLEFVLDKVINEYLVTQEKQSFFYMEILSNGLISLDGKLKLFKKIILNSLDIISKKANEKHTYDSLLTKFFLSNTKIDKIPVHRNKCAHYMYFIGQFDKNESYLGLDKKDDIFKISKSHIENIIHATSLALYVLSIITLNNDKEEKIIKFIRTKKP